LETAGLNPNLRPENLSLAQYVQLANVYAQSNSATRANVAEHTG
jgi:hypothetical protein